MTCGSTLEKYKTLTENFFNASNGQQLPSEHSR
jgi:hypothetical protein